MPLVAIVFAIRKTLRALFTALVDLVDWAFPILLQVMRFPLFTLRIVGDAIVALLKGVVRLLPIGPTRRDSWREVVSEYWAWLRGKISYKAFEEWLHHAFESGMAWVFKKCRALSPRAAFIVLMGAILWLPISFGIATLMHMVLIAKALSLPAWMQLLHPVATVIAKSKLLVLPVYPAAWPQAKLHPFVQAMISILELSGDALSHAEGSLSLSADGARGRDGRRCLQTQWRLCRAQPDRQWIVDGAQHRGGLPRSGDSRDPHAAWRRSLESAGHRRDHQPIRCPLRQRQSHACQPF